MRSRLTHDDTLSLGCSQFEKHLPTPKVVGDGDICDNDARRVIQGDFSASLCFGRNDEDCYTIYEISPLRSK